MRLRGYSIQDFRRLIMEGDGTATGSDRERPKRTPRRAKPARKKPTAKTRKKPAAKKKSAARAKPPKRR